jgi:hypothetical protein
MLVGAVIENVPELPLYELAPTFGTVTEFAPLVHVEPMTYASPANPWSVNVPVTVTGEPNATGPGGPVSDMMIGVSFVIVNTAVLDVMM